MSPNLEVLVGKETVSVGGQAVEVKELSWPDALAFMRLMFEKLGGGKLFGVTDEGKPWFDLSKMPLLVAGCDELSTFLLQKSTGRDEAWLATLSFREGLEVLDVAIRLNVNEAMVGKVKEVGGRIGKVFGVTPTAPLPPTS